jgi:hypothetical protein
VALESREGTKGRMGKNMAGLRLHSQPGPSRTEHGLSQHPAVQESEVKKARQLLAQIFRGLGLVGHCARLSFPICLMEQECRKPQAPGKPIWAKEMTND